MKHITGQWPATTKRDYGEPLYDDPRKLHYELAGGRLGEYGPHICACHGYGWLRSETAIGTMIRCEQCNAVRNRQLGRCWELSQLRADAVDVPSLLNFEVHDDASRVMLKAARAFAQAPKGWLTFYGTWGAGKTHLAEAITRYLLSRKVPCAMLRAPELFVYLGAVERRDGDDVDYDGRLRHLSELDVLVVDELGKEPNTPAVQKRRTMLLDARYRQERPTMLVSNDPPERWPDPALASRVSDTRFVVVEATKVDFRKVAR